MTSDDLKSIMQRLDAQEAEMRQLKARVRHLENAPPKVSFPPVLVAADPRYGPPSVVTCSGGGGIVGVTKDLVHNVYHDSVYHEAGGPGSQPIAET